MATSTFDKVSSSITSGLHDAGERIVDIKDDASRDLGRRLDGLGKLMRSHPLLTIAIGVAAGYLAARLIRRD